MEKRTMGALMAALRKSKGMTQQDVADRLGVSNKTVSKWECDDGYPDISALPAIAELYGITVDELLRGEVKNAEKGENITAPNEKVLSHLLNKAKHKYTNMSVLSFVLFLLSSAVAFITKHYVPSDSGYIVIAVVSLLLIAGGIVTQYLGISQFTLTLKDEELINTAERSNCYVLLKWWLFANLTSFMLAVLICVWVFVAYRYAWLSAAGILMIYLFVCLVILVALTLGFEKKINPDSSGSRFKVNNKKFFTGLVAVFIAVTVVVYGCYAVYNELSYEKFELQSEDQTEQIEEFLDGEKYIALDEILADGENVYKSFPKEYDNSLALTVVYKGGSEGDFIEGYKHYNCDSVIRGWYYNEEKYGGEIFYNTIIFSSKAQKDAFIKTWCVKDSSYLSGMKLAILNNASGIEYASKNGLTAKYRDFYVSMDDALVVSVIIGFAADLIYVIIFYLSIHLRKTKHKNKSNDK